jgi:L-seryl-tRNA(Ser) seleniumtransferase
VGDRAEIGIQQGTGRVGGGSLPMGDLPGPRVDIHPKRISAGRLENNLRSGTPPVIALVQEDTVLIDPRTLLAEQAEIIPELVAKAL